MRICLHFALAGFTWFLSSTAQIWDLHADSRATPSTLLTDPFLQLPTADGAHIVWFTEWRGTLHRVVFGTDLDQVVIATSKKLSRTAEDAHSWVDAQNGNGSLYQSTTPRHIWRHEAYVEGLAPGERVPYFVSSVTEDGLVIKSKQFTVAPLPKKGQPLKILLTSDHQLTAMTTTNLQMVARVTGGVDAVFFAGDLQNVPDRASGWFDDNRGGAFFPALQGRASFELETKRAQGDRYPVSKQTYSGGELIQHAPIFPVIGNHEVMGRFKPENSLNSQLSDPHPRSVAKSRYAKVSTQLNSDSDLEARSNWIRDHSFNTITYEELFTLPVNLQGNERYYALQFGDVFLVGLYSTRIWRHPRPGQNSPGKYSEPAISFEDSEKWGYGDFIFEDLSTGSKQYAWLKEIFESTGFKKAKYRVVLMHQGPHGLGQNYLPAFTRPVQIIDRTDTGTILSVRYEYPLEQDILVNHVRPLFEKYDVHLVHQGHNHVWFRLKKDSVNYLETSNVGSTFGCYLEGYKTRTFYPNDPRPDVTDYPLTGDPHGLNPIFPSEFSPQKDQSGRDLPCVNSNHLTVFSILYTDTGTVRSYVFDTRLPESDPVLFDEFSLR